MRDKQTGEAAGPDHAVAALGYVTQQRSALLRLLNGLDEFHTARELHERLLLQGNRIGLTTVYRALQSLRDAGELDAVRTESGEFRYRRCSGGHHHHLVCRSCGRTVELPGDAIERWAGQVATDFGYTQVSHTVELFGICESCSATASRGVSTRTDPSAGGSSGRRPRSPTGSSRSP